MYDNSKEVTKEFVLSSIGEVAIFMKYLNLSYIKEEELICNPLRDDRTPTASFKWVNDRIQFRDWSETFSRDCFNVAQYVTGKKNFHDTLIQIAVDFNLISGLGRMEYEPVNIDESLTKIRKENKKKIIEIKVKEYHKVDLDYWKQFGISQSYLNKFRVYSISEAYIDGLSVYYWKKNDIGFAFYFENGDFKLYFPLRDKKYGKFIHNNASVLQGYNQLPESGDYLLITKSYKDVISLRETAGIISVAPMSETMTITDEVYENLKTRFKNLFLLNDNDIAGKKATIKTIKKYPDIKPLLFPKGDPKDYTDNILVYGINDMVEVVNHWKERLL